MQTFVCVLLLLACAGVARRTQLQRSTTEPDNVLKPKAPLNALASLILGVNPTDAFSHSIGRRAASYTPGKHFVSRARTKMVSSEPVGVILPELSEGVEDSSELPDLMPSAYTLLMTLGYEVDMSKVDLVDPEEPSYVAVAKKCYKDGCPTACVNEVVTELKKYLPDYQVHKAVTSLEGYLKGEGYFPEENIPRVVRFVAYGLDFSDVLPLTNPDPIELKAWDLMAKYMDSFGEEPPMEMEIIPAILEDIMDDEEKSITAKNYEMDLIDFAIDKIDESYDWPEHKYNFPAELADKILPPVEPEVKEDMLPKFGSLKNIDLDKTDAEFEALFPSKEEVEEDYRKKVEEYYLKEA